jgi:hypothetical protein
MQFPPVESWLSEVLADESQDLWVVFWHHYSCGSYTHTSAHGVFFDLDDAIHYAVALVQRAASDGKVILGEPDIAESEEEEDSDITSDWDSQDLEIVNRSGERIFHQVSQWNVSDDLTTAWMSFDCDTHELIRKSIEIDAAAARQPLGQDSAHPHSVSAHQPWNQTQKTIQP